MKRILNKLINGNMTSVLLVVGFALSFFVTFNAIKLVDEYVDISSACNNCGYKDEFELSVIFDNQDDIIYHKLNECIKKISMLDGGNIYVDFQFSSFVNGLQNNDVYYILCCNEKPVRRLVSGRYPTNEEIRNGELLAVIGSTVETTAYHKDGKEYIDINDCTYEVIGVLEDIYNNAEINEVVYVTGFDDIKRYLDESICDISVFVGTEKHNPDKIYQDIQKIFSDERIEIEKYEMDEYYQSDMELVYNNIFLKLTSVFDIILVIAAVSNCVVVSELWINSKLYEFAVKRAFGKGIGAIISDIYGQLSVKAIIALVIALVFELIYCMFFETDSILFDFNSILLFIVAFAVITMITLLIPVAKIIKLKPAIALKSL